MNITQHKNQEDKNRHEIRMARLNACIVVVILIIIMVSI